MAASAILTVVLGLLGLIVGGGLAEVSVRLPLEGAAVTRRVWPRYPIITVAAGAIGVWAGLSGANALTAGATALLGWQLLLIAVVDAEHHWLPDALTWPLAGTGLVATGLIAQGPPWPQVAGLVIGFGGLWLLGALYKAVRKRDGLGGGDPFLLAAAGAWVGWTGLPSVLLWGCGVGFGLIIVKRIGGRTVQASDRLPFGTFLAIGVWLVWLYGPLI